MTDDLGAAALAPDEFVEFISRPELRVDPYPFFHRLRALDPVHRLPGDIGWLASRYDDVLALLRDPRLSTDERNATVNALTPHDQEPSPFTKFFQSMMLFRDPPDHTRLRALVQKAFSRKVVEQIRPRVESLVEELLDGIVERGTADLIEEFAYPLPVVVICELLGVPVADRERFHGWARDLANRFEVQLLRTPEMEARGDAATASLFGYFDTLIADKRAHPRDDLLSALAAVDEGGDRLSHEELLAICVLLLLAGHETTANLLGNGVLALLHNRDQWDRLCSQPELVRSGVEELLRYDPPVQLVLRIALEDIDLGSRTVSAGEMVVLMLGAANRDPSRFPEPDRLDVGRGGEPIVAFGGGIHFCLGAPLARLEAQIALAGLVRRAPSLRLAGEPNWRSSFVIRGLESLPVAVG